MTTRPKAEKPAQQSDKNVGGVIMLLVPFADPKEPEDDRPDLVAIEPTGEPPVLRLADSGKLDRSVIRSARRDGRSLIRRAYYLRLLKAAAHPDSSRSELMRVDLTKIAANRHRVFIGDLAEHVYDLALERPLGIAIRTEQVGPRPGGNGRPPAG